ncbi:MAG: CrcB family protein [Actinomycetales bacterium]|nr:CrcB family protein [Actinomycetales bacterium]
MSDLTWGALLLIAAVGGLGAVLRYVSDGLATYLVQTRWPESEFPWGLWFVNISGSMLMGLTAGVVLSEKSAPVWAAVVMTGLLGGYTTFSSASYDTVRLIREGRIFAGFSNAFGVLGIAVVAAGIGLWLGVSA